MFVSSVHAESQFNMTKGVTDVSQNVYDLHMMVMWICTAIGIVVFGAMFWSMLFHRKSKGSKPADFHESTKVEILWTAIPVFILIAMAWPATKTLIAMEDNSNSDITIQVTGSQWKWHYKYFDQGIEFYSVLATPREQFDNREGEGAPKGENYLLEVDKPLVIPVNRKVRFLITSDDVIHSWWVPAFAVKQDANPGFINEAWTKVNEPGIYRGRCAELCGKDHGYMPIVVDVRSEVDYEQWINEQKIAITKAKQAEAASLNAQMSMDELMSLGQQTYTAHCAACHQPNGQGLPPAFPALAGSGIAIDPEKVSEHINVVFHGRAGTGMQGYGKQLSLKEIAAVVTYERNAWGNNTGDAVQAKDVQNTASGDSADTADTASAAPASTAPTSQALVADVASDAEQSVAASASDTMDDLEMSELMTLGEQVYIAKCAACHQANGEGMPPAFPGLKGSAIATGDISAHIDMVVNGKPGTAMMGFASQLSAQEMAAVITYERNAWGNDTGDVVQAKDVAK
ncbi:cytochrome c oxidase subunit II [Thalassotalea ponticola]|uniref:cytochrome c oxidase subunit II n=1 Tax=Thalassotalea ponticola TaxID=1523392 RepID=UPI0025B5FD17|nr:cytochrome c oxidase subunit II [Thalassotalea ponticola]MDN3652280.1 cytochrome c oxidase subunit II [Thalassotalea ponticola]